MILRIKQNGKLMKVGTLRNIEGEWSTTKLNLLCMLILLYLCTYKIIKYISIYMHVCIYIEREELRVSRRANGADHGIEGALSMRET